MTHAAAKTAAPTAKLSPTMREALARIEREVKAAVTESEDRLARKGPDFADPAKTRARGVQMTWALPITVQALLRRGLIEKAHSRTVRGGYFKKYAWGNRSKWSHTRDHEAWYRLTDAGRSALAGLTLARVLA